MLSRNEFKYIQSLFDKKNRQEEGLFIAEGPKLIEELLKSNYTIKKMYATDNWIVENLDYTNNLTIVNEAELSRMTGLQNANKVFAIVHQPENVLQNLDNQFSIVLDGIQDPGNFGTIIRIADWYGIKNILCSEDCVELYNPKVIQSTMGSFVRVHCWYGNITTVLQESSIPVYGALLNGKNVQLQNKVKEGFLVIGNEGKGISNEILPYINHAITIPRIGGAESLNAAVATGIILSHII
jgi:TrmH family RNA methyltransferase